MIKQVFYRTHTVQKDLNGMEFESTNKPEAIVIVWENDTGGWVPAQMSAVFTKTDGSIQAFKQDYPKVIKTGEKVNMSVDIIPFAVPGEWTCDVIIEDPFKLLTVDAMKVTFKVLTRFEKPAVTFNYDIKPNIRGYQFIVDTEYMFDVRFNYTGGHGSGGDLHAYVPRIYQNQDETDDAYKRRLSSETLNAVADVVKDNEELRAAKAHSDKYVGFMNATYRGSRGQIHIN